MLLAAWGEINSCPTGLSKPRLLGLQRGACLATRIGITGRCELWAGLSGGASEGGEEEGFSGGNRKGDLASLLPERIGI